MCYWRSVDSFLLVCYWRSVDLNEGIPKAASLFECHLNIDLVSLFKREGANQSCIANICLQTHGKSDVAVTHQSYQNECCHRPIVFHCRSLHVFFSCICSCLWVWSMAWVSPLSTLSLKSCSLPLSVEYGWVCALYPPAWRMGECVLFAPLRGVRVSVCSLPPCVVYGWVCALVAPLGLQLGCYLGNPVPHPIVLLFSWL